MTKSKPTIFFDLDAAVQAQKSGIGYYSAGLLQSLAANNDFKITAHYFDFLGKNKPSLPSISGVTYVSSKLLHRKAFNLLRRIHCAPPIEILARSRFSFSVFPNFLNRPSVFHTKYCVTIHDFTYVNYPDTVSERNRKDLSKFVPSAVKSSDFVLCISETVAKELRNKLPQFKSKKIVITRIPADIELNNNLGLDALRRVGIVKDFILFIGNLEPRKNLDGLLDAYLLLPKSIKDSHQLVIIGGSGWNNKHLTEKIAYLKHAGDNIVTTGYVNDDLRAKLYSESTLVVMPSFYEGYGMPIVEAMTFGKRIAASDIPVFREVSKDSLTFFDPSNVRDISHKIERALQDTKFNAKKYDTVLKDLAWPRATDELGKEIMAKCS